MRRDEFPLIDKIREEAYQQGRKDALKEKATGEWEERQVEAEGLFSRTRYYCTACGSWNTYGKTKYCPNCGAKMRRNDEPDN